MKRALAIALTGLGLSFAGHGPASAAAIFTPGVIAPLTNPADDSLTPVGFGRCFELPVVGAFVAFFELLRDEEFDHHCGRHFHGEYYYRHTDRKRHYR